MMRIGMMMVLVAGLAAADTAAEAQRVWVGVDYRSHDGEVSYYFAQVDHGVWQDFRRGVYDRPLLYLHGACYPTFDEDGEVTGIEVSDGRFVSADAVIPMRRVEMVYPLHGDPRDHLSAEAGDPQQEDAADAEEMAEDGSRKEIPAEEGGAEEVP